MNLARRKTNAAFTLLEVLVAISIFAVLTSAIATVFYSALRMRNLTTAAIENTLPVEDALDTIRHDLANIVAPNGVFAGRCKIPPSPTRCRGKSARTFSHPRVNWMA